ncbi:hypothetical protein MKW92_021974, partial [Papaver armeniacum]
LMTSYVFFYGYLLALIRHNKPGVAAFRLANGYGSLRDALSSDNVMFQRALEWWVYFMV